MPPEDRELAEANARMDRVLLARDAITAAIGPWRRGKSADGYGLIDCPVCQGKQTLRFRRAACNGHVHAKCSTPDCVSWME